MIVRRRAGIIAIRASTIAIALSAWEVAGRVGVINTRLVPTPTLVLAAAAQMLASGELAADTIASLERVAVGFAGGAITAVAVALLTGRSLWLRESVGQMIQVLRPIPVIAFVPFAIIWFGLGEVSKYFLVGWGVFFPVWLGAHAGISRADLTLVRVARSLGASERSVITHVILPNAIPFVVTGARTGIGIAFVCLVAAEMAGALAGVGYRITVSYLVFDVSKMVVGLIVLGVLGATADATFVWIVRRLLPWYEPPGAD